MSNALAEDVGQEEEIIFQTSFAPARVGSFETYRASMIFYFFKKGGCVIDNFQKVPGYRDHRSYKHSMKQDPCFVDFEKELWKGVALDMGYCRVCRNLCPEFFWSNPLTAWYDFMRALNRTFELDGGWISMGSVMSGLVRRNDQINVRALSKIALHAKTIYTLTDKAAFAVYLMDGEFMVDLKSDVLRPPDIFCLGHRLAKTNSVGMVSIDPTLDGDMSRPLEGLCTSLVPRSTYWNEVPRCEDGIFWFAHKPGHYHEVDINQRHVRLNLSDGTHRLVNRFEYVVLCDLWTYIRGVSRNVYRTKTCDTHYLTKRGLEIPLINPAMYELLRDPPSNETTDGIFYFYAWIVSHHAYFSSWSDMDWGEMFGIDVISKLCFWLDSVKTLRDEVTAKAVDKPSSIYRVIRPSDKVYTPALLPWCYWEDEKPSDILSEAFLW